MDTTKLNETTSVYLETTSNRSFSFTMTAYQEKPWDFFKQSTPMVIILSLAYVVIFVLGIVNNCLVVSIIYRNRQLRTVTNYFIANLAIADILVCTMMPVTLLSNILYEWWYGAALCKGVPYLQGVAAGASVNTLAAVAMESSEIGDEWQSAVTDFRSAIRNAGYLAIFYPTTKRVSARSACVVIALIWIIPMCIFTPWIIVYTQITYRVFGFDYVICTAQWSSLEQRRLFSVCVILLTCYLLPLILIAIFYFLIGIRVWKRKVRGMRGTAQRNIARRKARIVRMLIVVFVIFFISWLPLYAIELRTLYGPPLNPAQQNVLKEYLIPFAQWLGASNSCVNPFIYVYFSKKFRRSVLAAFRSRKCCSRINA